MIIREVRGSGRTGIFQLRHRRHGKEVQLRIILIIPIIPLELQEIGVVVDSMVILCHEGSAITL